MPKGDGNRNKGKGLAWIMAHLDYAGDDCLPYPFSRNNYGYGQVGYKGKVYKASRLMCELKHGPAPEDKPQAAHSCGNGHLACCNQKHLSWKDNSANQIDRRIHGSPEGGKGTRTHLTPAQVAEIRSSKGIVSQIKLAEKFGVKRGSVEYWQRTNHEPLQFSEHKYNVCRRKSA